MEGLIRLRWTSHPGTILSVFDALLSSESFVDVTLACEGQYIRAHKVILSACSPYFQELLKVDVNKHPIFFLKDVKYSELQALIQYMYRGEVNIAQEDLDSLLQVAQSLKIRGLDVEKSKNCISSDTIIPRDLGNPNRHKSPPLPLAQPLPPPPAPIRTPSNVHFPRSFKHPSHSFVPPNLNLPVSFASPIVAAAPSVAQPPVKKIRVEPIPSRPPQSSALSPHPPVKKIPVPRVEPIPPRRPQTFTLHPHPPVKKIPDPIAEFIPPLPFQTAPPPPPPVKRKPVPRVESIVPPEPSQKESLLLSPVFNRTRRAESSESDEDETQGPEEFPPTPPPQRSATSVSERRQKPSFRSMQSIVDDFDKIPNPQPVEPKFAFKSEKPIRKKEERKKLPGWDCPTCRNYYEAMASEMEPGELEKLRNKCSKHRSKLPEPDLLGNTPRYYWDLDFPSTEECLQNGLIRIGERSQRN